MSQLVGWMVNFYGGGRGATRQGARLYSSAAFPARTQIEQNAQTNPLLHLRFAPSGGWIAIHANNTWTLGNTPPADLVSAIQAGIGEGGLTLIDIYFTPTNDWLIKWYQKDGSRHYAPSTNFPEDIFTIINEFDLNGSGSELLCLTFPPPANVAMPNQNGLAVTNAIWNNCVVICDNNKIQGLNNPPADSLQQLNDLIAEGQVIRSLVYSSASGWIITVSNGQLFANGAFDPWILQLTQQIESTGDQDDYLKVEDIVIETPVRNYTFEVIQVKCKTTRSGFLNFQDTISIGGSISVVNFDTVTFRAPSPAANVVYCGNRIRTNTTIGLNGDADLQTGTEIQSSYPPGPSAAYAMSVGPIQISDPRATVVFTLGVLNMGNGGPGELTGIVQTIAKAGEQVAQQAITALVSAYGTPALGSITGTILTNVSNFAFNNCDGLVALDTVNTSGATLFGLASSQLAASETPQGNILVNTQEYSNVTFPNEPVLGLKSPYNAPGTLCQSSDYIVTYSIQEYDTEFNVPYAAPTQTTGKLSTGSPLVIQLSSNWPQGHRINTVDSALLSLDACSFLNSLYLFWNANDQSQSIFFSASSNGISWPNGAQLNPNWKTAGPVTTSVFVNNAQLNQLYVFWADSQTRKMFFSVTTDGSTFPNLFSVNQGDSTSSSPAACVFGGHANLGTQQLYLFWRANDPSNRLFFSSYSGATDENGSPLQSGNAIFTNGTPINTQDSTSAAPCACTFQGSLYLFWKLNDNNNKIFYSIAENNGGTSIGFPSGNTINNTDTVGDGPLAAFEFQNQLFLFWRGVDNFIYFSSSWGGENWPAGVRINTVDQTPQGLSACSFMNQLSVFWKANDAGNEIYTTSSQSPMLLATST